MNTDIRGNISYLKGLLATIKGHFEPSMTLKKPEHTYQMIDECLKIAWDLEDLTTENLSEREREVIKYIVEGLSNIEIGERLFVCEKTVKFHLSRIYKKLGVKGRPQLIVEYYKNELSKARSDKDILQKEVERLSGGNSGGRRELPAGSPS